MRASILAVLATALLGSFVTPLGATSLQVSPVRIELQAPGTSAVVNLRNDGTNAVNVQIRVFRWAQVNGEEKLDPTDDVVASPPIANLAPQTDYTVRIVRVTKRPLAAGESYRLLVDELPGPVTQQSTVVNLVVRYSIPVFFYPREAADAKVAWVVGQRNGRTYVSATNDGDRHIRVSALTLRDGNGTTVSFGNGLTGYVLGRSTMRWAAPANTGQLRAGGSVLISAQGEHGPINATPSAQAPR